MEKLITKRNIFIASGLGILLIILAYFFLLNSNKETEKYFDIYLANLYNEDTQGIDQKMEYLSNISCLLYTSPSPRDKRQSRMPSSA